MKSLLRLLLTLWLVPGAALAQPTPPASESQPASESKPAPASKPASVPTPGVTASSEAEAGDVSEVDKDKLGPLRERIRPVSGHVFLKKGRFEFSPSVTFSVRDAFFTKYVLGGTATYYPMETLGISLRAGYALNSVAGSAQICRFSEGERGCESPDFDDLDGKAPGQITLLGGVDVQWAPIYGKLSLLAEKFLHFDMYGVLGATAVQYRGPLKEGETGLSSSRLTPGANVGVGFRFFVNRWMTVRTEVRDLIYVEKFRTTDSDSTLRNQLMFELGFSFFLPTVLPES